MTPAGVRSQIEDVINRLIRSSLSAKQFSPSFEIGNGGSISIGAKNGTSIALKNTNYSNIYTELEGNELYHVKLVDGALLLFQYQFSPAGKIEQHRLLYFPSPVLPTLDEAPALYEQDELYGDIIEDRLVRFPVRFDYAPAQKIELVHPCSHLTLGQYQNCRIPVTGPMPPISFGLFIVRNFYFRSYRKFKNVFDRRSVALSRIETLVPSEKRITHVVHGF